MGASSRRSGQGRGRGDKPGKSTTARSKDPAPASAKARRATAKGTGAKAATRKAPARKAATRESAPRKSTAAKAKPRASAPRTAASRKAATAARSPAAGRRRDEASLERRFEVLLHTSCLKAGTAAAAGGLTRRVPMLGRLAPVLMGDWLERHSVDALQEQLVRDVLALYELELSEPEEQGVVLLATGARTGAGELSQRTVNDLVARLGAPFGRMLLDRVLPVTTMVAENAAAVASTYAVGRRAQALCRLSLSDASNIGELLANITGIDQNRLVSWSGEALKLALKPFRRVLGSFNPLG